MKPLAKAHRVLWDYIDSVGEPTSEVQKALNTVHDAAIRESEGRELDAPKKCPTCASEGQPCAYPTENAKRLQRRAEAAEAELDRKGAELRESFYAGANWGSNMGASPSAFDDWKARRALVPVADQMGCEWCPSEHVDVTLNGERLCMRCAGEAVAHHFKGDVP